MCSHIWIIGIDAFMCVTHWYDVSLYVWRDSLLCVTRLTFTCVWQDLFVPVCVTWLSHMCVIWLVRMCVTWLDSIICVWQHSHSYVCVMTSSYVRDTTDSYVSQTHSYARDIVRDTIHSYICVCHICAPRLIHVCAPWLIRMCVSRLIHMCVPWLIDIWVPWHINICAPLLIDARAPWLIHMCVPWLIHVCAPWLIYRGAEHFSRVAGRAVDTRGGGGACVAQRQTQLRLRLRSHFRWGFDVWDQSSACKLVRKSSFEHRVLSSFGHECAVGDGGKSKWNVGSRGLHLLFTRFIESSITPYHFAWPKETKRIFWTMRKYIMNRIITFAACLSCCSCSSIHVEPKSLCSVGTQP